MLWIVTAIWDKVPGIAEHPASERHGIGLVCILGVIGGLIRWQHKLFTGAALDRNAFLSPLEGAALSLVVVVLLRAGMLRSSAVARTKEVNWLGMYAISGLTGLFAMEAVARLEKILRAIFN